MAQLSSSNPNSLPGIVTDQPEIFESEPPPSDDTGVHDLDLLTEPDNDAIALIEVPIQQAFSYFAERENEIAQFYVQRYGEYKIKGDKPEDETDLEKYHRLVTEVNQLLNKFQADKVSQSEIKAAGNLDSTALITNLEVLSKQLKSLEFAAEHDNLNPTQAGFKNIKSKLDHLGDRELVDGGEIRGAKSDEAAQQIRMSILERRLNILESLLGYTESKAETIFKATKCKSLVDVAKTLSSWMSLLEPDNIQRINRELDYLTQRLEKIHEQATENKLDPQAKTKLDQLCNLVTVADKYRAKVPEILHQLSSMEELKRRAAEVSSTVNSIEYKQSEIASSLELRKQELSALPQSFNENIELLKELSSDIETRITALRERDQ